MIIPTLMSCAGPTISSKELKTQSTSIRKPEEDDTLRGVPTEMPEFDAEAQKSFDWLRLEKIRKNEEETERKTAVEKEIAEKADQIRTEREEDISR